MIFFLLFIFFFAPIGSMPGSDRFLCRLRRCLRVNPTNLQPLVLETSLLQTRGPAAPRTKPRRVNGTESGRPLHVLLPSRLIRSLRRAYSLNTVLLVSEAGKSFPGTRSHKTDSFCFFLYVFYFLSERESSRLIALFVIFYSCTESSLEVIHRSE